MCLFGNILYWCIYREYRTSVYLHKPLEAASDDYHSNAFIP